MSLRGALPEIFPAAAQRRAADGGAASMKLGAVRGRIVGEPPSSRRARTYKGVLWSVRRAREVA